MLSSVILKKNCRMGRLPAHAVQSGYKHVTFSACQRIDMDRYVKRIIKIEKKLDAIRLALKRIEILVVELYESRFSEPSQQSRPPPRNQT